MGNRAFITAPGASVGIYLHWNGGLDSITAFLRYAELAGLPKASHEGYWLAPYAGMLVNYFRNDGHTVSIETCDPRNLQATAPDDNGTYVIEDYRIVGRIHGPEFEQRTHDLQVMLREIDEKQPERDRLDGFLDGVEVDSKSLDIGAQVWTREYFGDGPKYKLRTVIGVGEPRARVNGQDRSGLPYVDRYDDQDNAKNPNSYLPEGVVRIPATV
ncbi:hypothetical protein AB3K78_01185 [Leucobacter sp. HNU]|uniref:hypothetical protein n=1 Tax=Leucobacter sp. HNU TaxID=3236805 RepID=UPI003A7FFA06